MARASAIFDAMIKAAPVRMWALILAGPVITAIDCGLILIAWLGGWPPALAAEQLRIVGVLAFTHAGIVGTIVIALAAARASARGPGGLSFDVESGPDMPGTIAKFAQTTTVETKPTGPMP
jgi:hypothetical protein